MRPELDHHGNGSTSDHINLQIKPYIGHRLLDCRAIAVILRHSHLVVYRMAFPDKMKQAYCHQQIGSFPGFEDGDFHSAKVGVAQQWFDELDNLAFSKDGMEMRIDDEERNSNEDSEDEKSVHIDCADNISPGTSEFG
ncbi:uncharacterized protein [Aristolochia californica]|uniref:uncharacterized protein n=1 Tax=Aristolochia californica TaxID=171875 RepID=UPI0035D7C3E0